MKWDIELNPLNNGADEIDQATAASGYSAFSVAYLEKLSQGSDVSLLATNSITFDLNGDRLDVGNGQSISFTTSTTGSITDASAGTIRTTGGGNITLNAFDAIDLGTTNLEAIGGGGVNLTSGGTTDITQTSGLNLGTVNSNGALNIFSLGNITATGAISSTTGTVDVTALNSSIDFDSSITSGANSIELNAFTGIDVAGTINANGAGGTFDVANVTSGDVVFSNAINASDSITINNAGGNLSFAGLITSSQNGINLDASGTITLADGARANDNVTGLLDVNAQNDAINPTIFLGGDVSAGNGGAVGIVFHDNVQILGGTSNVDFRTNNITFQNSLDANNNDVTFRARNYVLNGGADSIFNSIANANMLTFRGFGDGDNIVFGGNGGNSRVTAANLNAFVFDSFADVNVGSAVQTGTVTVDSNITANANIGILGNTGDVTLNGSITSTQTDGNITITSTALDIGNDIVTTAGTAGNIDIDASNNITISGTNVQINAGAGVVDFFTGGGHEIATNDELTVTGSGLISDDNFNGDLAWRVVGTAPTGSFVASAGSNLTLEQDTASDSINIGSASMGAGNIGLSNAIVSALDTNFDEIIFGRSDGGAVLNSMASFNNNISVLSNATFTNEAALDMAANTLNVTTTGDIILDDDITSSAMGNAIVLSTADDFINNAGNDALDASNINGRWLVYSDDPVGNQNNGLLPGESLFGQADLTTALGNATANTDAYAYLTATRPTITYDVDDVSVEYGEALGVLSVTYNSGLVGDDIITAIGESNSPTLSSSYILGIDADTYAGDLTGVTGPLTNVLGYQYSFNPGDLIVTQADLNISVDPASETINQGEPLPSYGLSFGPFKLADTFADLDVLPTLTTPDNSIVGSFPVTLSGGSDINYNFIFTNGTLDILALVATNNDVTIPSTVEQDLSNRILGNGLNNQKFNIPVLEASSLPDSQIDIEIEGVDDEGPELNAIEDRKRKIKLKIDKDLANQLNLQINDGVL